MTFVLDLATLVVAARKGLADGTLASAAGREKVGTAGGQYTYGDTCYRCVVGLALPDSYLEKIKTNTTVNCGNVRQLQRSLTKRKVGRINDYAAVVLFQELHDTWLNGSQFWGLDPSVYKRLPGFLKAAYNKIRYEPSGEKRFMHVLTECEKWLAKREQGEKALADALAAIKEAETLEEKIKIEQIEYIKA